MITTRQSRTHKLLLALLLAGIALLVFQPFPHDLSVCIFRNIAGIPCPACGTGHGMEALMNGEFHSAWNFNPLSYIVFAAGMLLIIILLNDYLRKQNKLEELLYTIQTTIHLRNPLTWLLMLAIFIVWIRNIHQSG